jgi:hypothetical protein
VKDKSGNRRAPRQASRRDFLKSAATGLVAAAGPTILGATDKAGSKRPIVGNGDHVYEVIHDWGQLPKHIRYGNTHGVRIDANGFVYIHHTVHATSESGDSMVVFDPQGKFVKSWGAEFKGGAHGLHIHREGSEEFLYLCDIQRNVVVKTTLQGKEVFTLGYPDQSDAYKPDPNGTKPKYTPTNLAIGPNGDIYVGDGYGSSFVVQYNKNGEYVRTFGGPGTEPGQLKVPHGIMLDDRGPEPLLLVADRSNNRLQYFTLEGKHLKFDYGVNLPCHFDTFGEELLVPDLAARVTIMNRNNQVIVHLGEGSDDWGKRREMSRKNFLPGKFVCPHGACYDREGNIFVVEWVETGRVTKLRKVG